MGLVTTIARRSLLGHPGRTAFSILGVALGIATVVAVFTLDHVTVLARTQTLDPGWGADLEVRPRAELADPREELLQLEGVAGVAAFFQNDVRFRPARLESGDDEGERIRMVGLEAGASRQLGVYHVELGSDLEPGDPRGVLVGRALAETFELEVGDPVLLAPPLRAAKKRCVDGALEVTGTATVVPMTESFRVAGVLANEGIGRKSKGFVVIVDYEAGRRLLADVFVSPQYWVRRDGATDLERLETRLQTGFTFERNASKAVGQAADERAFRNGVRMAGLFALLLGLFVIFHTLSMSLLERQREVGALHSLAASRGQIARVFFAEALVIALAAGALGLLGGLGLAKALLGLGITTLGVTHPVPLIEVPWETVLLLASLGILIALLGSVYPILRMRGTDVVTTLRGEDPGRRGGRQGFQLFTTLLLVAVVPAAFFQVVPIVGAAESTLVGTVLVGLVALGLLVGMPLLFPALVAAVTTRMARAFERPFPLAGKLAAQNLRQNPGRIGAAIAAIALVTAAFVGLKGMTRSLAAEVAVWGEAALGNKILVERLPDVPLADVAAALHTQPGVNAVESGDARVFVSFLLLGARSDELGRFGPLAQDPTLLRALREERGMIVSDRLARQRGLRPGDPVLVNTSGHGVQEFRVILVSDAYGYFFHPDERAYGIVDDRHIARYFCLDTTTTRMIAVHMDEPDMELVRTVLHERFPAARGLAFHDGRSVVELMLEDLTRDFVLFDIILGLTAALAGLGVLNGQLLSALERQKEFGVLRALGMTRGQVAGVVFLESGIVGISGALLGVAVGTGLTPVLVESLRLLSDLPLPLRTAGPWIAFSMVGAVLLAFLAGLYPIWRTNRLDAVRAVRTG